MAKTLGPYRLLESLGRGGMGEVFRAEHRETGDIVAIKTLLFHPENLDELEFAQVRQRFLREGSELIQLTPHDHVVRVIEILEQPEVAQDAIVMEYLQGHSLDEILDITALKWKKAVRYAQGIAAALEHIHRNGLIHRDVKPSNIVLADKGKRPVLVDFGLVKDLNPLDESTRLTVTSQFLGTPEYASPEQLLGKPLTPATDVFSFGSTLHQMLTGQSPFQGETQPEVCQRVCYDHPPKPREVESQIPAKISELTSHCLRKSAGERPESMTAILGILENPVRTGWRSPKVRRLGFPMAAALVATLFVVAFIVFPGPGPGPGGSPPPPLPPPTANGSPPGLEFAVLPFSGDAPSAAVLSAALAADLQQSGYRIIDPHTVLGALNDLQIERSSFDPAEHGPQLREYLDVDGWIYGAITAHDGTVGLWQVRSAMASENQPNHELDAIIGTSPERLAEQVADRFYRLGSIRPDGAARTRARSELPAQAEAIAPFAQGRLALGAGNPMAARRLFEQALEAAPDSPVVLAHLVDVLRRLGLDKPATDLAEKTLKSSALGNWEKEIRLQIDLLRASPRTAEARRQTYEGTAPDFEVGLAWLKATEARDLDAALVVLDRLGSDGSLSGLPADRERIRLHLEKSQFARALALADAFLDKAQRLGAARSQALAQLYRAIALQGQSRPAEATEALDDAQRRLTLIDDPLLEAQALEWAGILLNQRGQAAVAVALHQKTRERYARLAESYGGAVEVFDALAAMHEGMALDQLGEKEKALGQLSESLKRLQRIGARREAANAAINLGVLHHWNGDLDRAAGLYTRGLKLAEQLGHQQLQGTALVNLGEVEVGQGRPRQGLQLFPQALSHFVVSERGGEPDWQVYTWLQQAETFFSIGELDQAQASFKEALRLSVKLNEPAASAAQAEAGLARVQRLRHDQSLP